MLISVETTRLSALRDIKCHGLYKERARSATTVAYQMRQRRMEGFDWLYAKDCAEMFDVVGMDAFYSFTLL